MIDIPEIESITKYEKPKLTIDFRAMSWCKLSYLDHPNGCPMYNKNQDCPPNAPLLHEFINFNKDYWLFIAKFNLKKQINKMKQKHSEWSDKKCGCSRYWQGTIHKRLRYSISHMPEFFDLIYTTKPEAMGLNVFATLRKMNIQIKKNPDEYIYKVALVGYPANETKSQSKII